MKTTRLLLAALLAFPLTTVSHVSLADAGKKPAASAKKSDAEQTDWGKPGKVNKQTRTIKVDMIDAMRFLPDTITVKEGETIRFVVTNSGRMMHEMVIGTPEKLKEHAAMMAKSPGMQHDAPYLAHVAPGKTGEIVWTFNRPGTFEFACLIAGHYEAGMRGTLVVTAKSGAAKKGGATPVTASTTAAVTTAATVEPTAASSNTTTQAANANALSEGVVRKIDTANGKITLKHGPLANLDMPAMTMVFKVQSPDMLKNVKVGDAVKFRVENLKNGYTVTTMERAAP